MAFPLQSHREGIQKRSRECCKAPAKKLLCSLEEMTATRVEEMEKKEWVGVCCECLELEDPRWPGRMGRVCTPQRR